MGATAMPPLLRTLAPALLATLISGAAAQAPDEFAETRRFLADAIERGVNSMREANGEPPIDPRVIAALAKVPRHEFAPPELRPYAYLDRPLPVGRDATISQPSLVAVMTDLLRIRRGEKVLEIGIGGGYHTAILAELTPEVFSVEYHAEAAQRAKGTLDRLGYGGVRVQVADGYHGWSAHAPYDAVLVRMAIPEVSPLLFDQIRPGGRLIAPIGPADSPQRLTLFHIGADQRVTAKVIMPVIFRALPGGIRL